MMDIAYALLKVNGGYSRRSDGTLFLFSTREEAALWAAPNEIIMPLQLSEF
jgi:hypothetical protein